MTGSRASSLTHVLEARRGRLDPRMEGKREAHYVDSKSLPGREMINIRGRNAAPVDLPPRPVDKGHGRSITRENKLGTVKTEKMISKKMVWMNDRDEQGRQTG